MRPSLIESTVGVDSGKIMSGSNHRYFGTIRDWTVNGLLNPQIPVESGEVIHMRVERIWYWISLPYGFLNVIAGDQGWCLIRGPKNMSSWVQGTVFKWNGRTDPTPSH